MRFRFLAALGLIMLQAPVFPYSRIWEANLARPSDFLPLGPGLYEDTSLIPYPQGDWRIVYSGSLAWAGLLRRESAAFAEIASGAARQELWVRPFARLDLALTWSAALDRNRYVDPGALDVSLGQDRRSYGVSAVHHLLPGGPGAPYLDAAVAFPDLERQAFAWMLAGGRRGIWHSEYSLSQRIVDEDFSVTNLDSAGAGEVVPGFYGMRLLTHRVLAAAPVAGGSLTLMGAYGEGTPQRPRGEFWLSDSSRRVDGSAAFAHPFPTAGGYDWGEWRLRAVYREAQATTFGRRIPPGSEGLKRFHYADNHGQVWEAGAERAAGPGDADGLRAGLVYRNYAWKSTPAPDALEARNETLSYNRLGLSFIANLYGGLFKMSEIIRGDARAAIWEAHGDWKITGRTQGGRAGSFVGTAGLSLYRTDFRVHSEGHSITQRLFVADTSAAYGRTLEGYFAGATPRLGAAWAWGRFRLEAAASQIIPIATRVREPGKPGSGAASGSETGYPPFRNGFAAEARIQAGY